MNEEMKYELLTELTSRLEADLLESYLEANGIDVELFQESIGHHAYPCTIDTLGMCRCSCRRKKLNRQRNCWKLSTNRSTL
jgi:hypothetical protein